MTVAPNEQARKNHDELFPGHVSALAVTDPELIEAFDNFAFDEVLRHGDLDTRTRLMVELASMITSQALREYRVMLGAALNVGNDRARLIDVLTQLLPFIGYPRTFNALRAVDEVAPA
jgi:4-carboxymuconolactone decarboxylase